MAGRLTGAITRVLLAVLALCSLASLLPRTSLNAGSQSDISGEWGFGFMIEGDSLPADLCIASLVQRESNLWSRMSCSSTGFHELTGTFDSSDSSFTLSGDYYGFPFIMAGTYTSHDPQADASGTWTLDEPPLSGTFAGFHALFGRGLVRCPEYTPSPKVFPPRDLDSIDAALILQYASGLSSSLPCLYLGDTNVDGRVDPVDAVLVLQYIADVIEHFPPY